MARKSIKRGITSKQRAARRKNIAVARQAKKRGGGQFGQDFKRDYKQARRRGASVGVARRKAFESASFGSKKGQAKFKAFKSGVRKRKMKVAAAKKRFKRANRKALGR